MVLFKKRQSVDQSTLGPTSTGGGSTTGHNGGRGQLPMLQFPDSIRYNILCVFGEFVGTFLFLFFSFAGTQVSMTPKPPDGSPPNTSNLLYSSLAFGFSLTVNVWAFFRFTGGLFNPAVWNELILVFIILRLTITGHPRTLCDWRNAPLRGLFVFPAQLVGGIAAAGVVSCLFPGPANFGTRLGGGTSISQGLFIEMFLTAQLVLVIIMLAVVKHKSTFLAPVGIGLAFFVCEMVGDYYTGGSLNPARSLGPDVINRSFPGYHWIYWVGPLLGSLLASGFYKLLVFVRWQNINPAQDLEEWEAKLRKGSTAPSEHTVTDQGHGQDQRQFYADVPRSNGGNEVPHPNSGNEVSGAQMRRELPPDEQV
ncbi:hypothetical protein N7510_001119 [Penicillium lagena]|uniref:uncharacterized protein n=1 Tax=Penicillium lagena TaxID=94218 RepID=UPI0025404FA1|nr:uncharacterized protein N7510_001119 [Penicillium lagena]KAJ5624810.1 hypothetical protein N7510_001119 [Penicillium lagena]